jgi:hypothetical protein
LIQFHLLDATLPSLEARSEAIISRIFHQQAIEHDLMAKLHSVLSQWRANDIPPKLQNHSHSLKKRPLFQHGLQQ